MNKTEKDNRRSLKREQLKNLISERRSQKAIQAVAKKAAVRRLAAEKRARSISERTYARQRKESFSGGEEAKPSSLTEAKSTTQAKNRQKLLSYLKESKVRKSEIIAERIRKRSAAAAEKRIRKEEKKRKKELLRQERLSILSQNRQQLLSYLKDRKAGGKTLAGQRLETRKGLKKEAVPKPELPAEEKKKAPVEEKPGGLRLKFPLVKSKKLPAEITKPAAALVKVTVSPKKPFKILPFLKEHYLKIFLLLLFVGWFIEISFLNKRLEIIRQQFEEAAGISKPHFSGEPLTTAKLPSMNLETARVEGIRDPFSDKLWRIQEITPAQVKTVTARAPRRPPVPPGGIIKPPAPVLITREPEFTPPEVEKAIPESAKIARIPQISVPQVTPKTEDSNLHFRGILNVAGIDYFFMEGPGGGYRVRVGDTVEGFKIYDYRNGVLYLSKGGHVYQLNEERVSPPLRYRGRMVMSGEEYFFLEGQHTYRSVIGDWIEGYQLIKRVGDYLYFIKDDRLYYLKQE